MKSRLGSKTIWWSTLLAGIGAAAQVLPDVAASIPTGGTVALISGIAGIILRHLTSTPLAPLATQRKDQ